MRSWVFERISIFTNRKKYWCCYHCDEGFCTFGEARLHQFTCPANPRNKLQAEVLQGLDKEVQV